MLNTSFEQLEKNIDELYDEQSRKLYEHIVEMGKEIFDRENPLYKYKNTDLLERLINHFESIEEYEKCSNLLKISRLLSGVE
jgi:uncharacterized protein YjgD (DUF1641 family)